jgi:tRNA guanosine-2'-O-methyltransferase
MRALQALCVLSRFITQDVAEIVCAGCIQAMGRQNAHNQLRYFVEIFTLRFARMHPAIFAAALVEQLSRTDLSLQMIASLMIITGNLIVGRYEKDFFTQYDGVTSVSLHSILAGVIPWLASTQGFTRAIAQLLVHKLIPRAIDVSVKAEGEDNAYHLRSIYRFLDENPEMRRLRSKQSKFFERYEVDSVCTPEGVLSIPVDESHEANPVHLVDVIKECLQQVFEEANVDRAPIWRQCQVQRARENEVSSKTTPHRGSSDPANDQDGELEGLVNFQRKIIPIDALNLAIEGLQEQRLRNIAGRLKQNLIVCASLIDKIPNLGGLARTSEIFAARQLVIPDLQVAKMDNFNSLSVGAGEWIDIVECREQVRPARAISVTAICYVE